MIESIFQLHNYQVAKKMMDVTHLRQKALAANLANVETPGYKRVDVAPNFRTELQRAVSDGDNALLQGLEAKLTIDKTAIARNRDGNTVQIESEMMKLSENAVEHSLATRLVSGTIKYLKLAITGRA